MKATPSLRNRLLAGALIPMLLFTLVEAVTQYQTLRQTVREAYDRFLVAAVYSVADSLHTEGGQLRGALPLALREAFEAAGGSRVFYRVSMLTGTLVAGDAELPRYQLPQHADRGFRPTSPTLSDAQMEATPLRMAVFYQLVEMSGGQQIAVIQVAHTLEARDQALWDALTLTVVRLVLFMAIFAVVMSLVVVRLMKPVDRLRSEVDARRAADLSPLPAPALRELQPVAEAFNHLMERQGSLLRQQERFVADASHQLRTPLTVLKTQLQSALTEPRGLVQRESLAQMERTVDRAASLAQQMLSLARVHQVSARCSSERIDLARVVEQAAVELSPLVAGKRLVFELQQAPVEVQADAWLLGELVRNLVVNAIRFTPLGGQLTLRVEPEGDQALFSVTDSGPGVPEDLLQRVFEPFFSTPGQGGGSGLGLSICRDITHALGGTIDLENCLDSNGAIIGLRATVRLPSVKARF